MCSCFEIYSRRKKISRFQNTKKAGIFTRRFVRYLDSPCRTACFAGIFGAASFCTVLLCKVCIKFGLCDI